MEMTTELRESVTTEVQSLREIFLQSDNVPVTFGEFVEELATGDPHKSDLPPDALFDAGGAAGFLVGVAEARGVSLRELIESAGHGRLLTTGPDECSR